MATLKDAKRIWNETTKRIVPQQRTRLAYLGDGRGFASSNLIVPQRPSLVYARDDVNSSTHFVVINRRVKPAFNLPVILGTTMEEPDLEQVLSIDYTPFDYAANASTIEGTQPHGPQHEFGGGDEVFVDTRLFKPGLAKPTEPAGMTIKILSFIHYYNGWKRFEETTTDTFNNWKPDTGSRFVLVAVDPKVNIIKYIPGLIFNEASFDHLLGGSTAFANIPSPGGDEIPIVAVWLTSTTTKIDWNDQITNNMFDVRMFINVSNKRILDRLDQLEGYLGFKPNLATTGAADTSADDFPRTIDGGIF